MSEHIKKVPPEVLLSQLDMEQLFKIALEKVSGDLKNDAVECQPRTPCIHRHRGIFPEIAREFVECEEGSTSERINAIIEEIYDCGSCTSELLREVEKYENY